MLMLLTLLVAHRFLGARNAPLLLAALRERMKPHFVSPPLLSEHERMQVASQQRRGAKRMFSRFEDWMRLHFAEEYSGGRTLARAEGGFLVAGDALDDHVKVQVGVHGNSDHEGKHALRRLLNSLGIQPDSPRLFVPAARPGPAPVLGAQRVRVTTDRRLRRLARRLDARMAELDRTQHRFDQHSLKLWYANERDDASNTRPPNSSE